MISKQFAENLKDVNWRLSNLYKVVNKHGEVVKFSPNAVQQDFLDNCHGRDIVLKARQLGITTLACIVALDESLFNNNWRCGIIAHNLDDANVFFDSKIKFAYDQLPPEIKAACSAVNDRAGTLKFSNGSQISVSTSFRSGTLQRLHVSEFGKICAKSPDKAKEIVTGAFPATENGSITIESTAEGQDGAFYDMTMTSMDLMRRDVYLGDKDFKFHFYPWFMDKRYEISDIELTVRSTTKQYFEKLATIDGIETSRDQQLWYQAEESVQGGDMKREYPSTPREAFEQAIEGAYFEHQIIHAIKAGNIGKHPMDPRYPVNTFWDLGRNDKTTIWLAQHIKGRHRFISYYENSGEDISHYIHKIEEWGRDHDIKWGDHYLPHDGDRQSLWLPEGTMELMADLGFHPIIVDRVKDKMTAINTARNRFASCDFDEDGCEQGLKHLRMYRKEFDEKRGVFRDKPRHDNASHGCLVAGTKVDTSRGRINIEHVSVGDMAWTPCGWAKVTASGITGLSKTLKIITLSSGDKITMTPDHKVFTTGGVVLADSLCFGDEIITSKDVECLRLANAKKNGYRDAFTESIGGIGIGIGQIENTMSARSVASKGYYTARLAGLTLERFTTKGLNIAHKIVEVREIEKKVPVYDLTIDHHHCYYANGMLVSNSDGFLTWATGFEPVEYEDEEKYEDPRGRSSATGY